MDALGARKLFNQVFNQVHSTWTYNGCWTGTIKNYIIGPFIKPMSQFQMFIILTTDEN